MTKDNRAINARAEMARGRRSLEAADQLAMSGLLDDAASRLYYAVFHMASAALLACDVEPTSHRGLQTLFSQYLVRPGNFDKAAQGVLVDLFALRNQSDYNRFFDVDAAMWALRRADAEGLLTALEAFVEARLGLDV